MPEDLPEGWPGEVLLEGRTRIHLPPNLVGGNVNLAGPASKLSLIHI